MTRTISFSIQKGGASKSTSSGITAYLLAQMGYNVLGVDMDPQGNFTSLLSGQSLDVFRHRTVLEALQDLSATPEELAKKYVHPIGDRLDIVAADDFLATFPRWLYDRHPNPNLAASKKELSLRDARPDMNPGLVLTHFLRRLNEAGKKYDYIIIDTPPALGDQTINAIAASDYVVAMFEPSKFCFDALPNLFETVYHIRKALTPKVEIIGILSTIIDARRADSKILLDALHTDEDYSELIFDTIIHRKATTGRLSIQGFEDNFELNDAVKEYRGFIEELLIRITTFEASEEAAATNE